jgi:hypothetical protein
MILSRKKCRAKGVKRRAKSAKSEEQRVREREIKEECNSALPINIKS